jgi:heme exporter protein D
LPHQHAPKNLARPLTTESCSLYVPIHPNCKAGSVSSAKFEFEIDLLAGNDVATWLSDPTAPAWFQAIGSIIAIVVAIVVPWWQRHNALHDARTERARNDKDHVKRLCAALRAEFAAAREAADRQQHAATIVLQGAAKAREQGLKVREEPIARGSMVLTDAIVYRQIAAELGRLPPSLTERIIRFYAYALEMGRMADASPTAEQACENLLGLAPRLRMNAAWLVSTLDRFEAADFDLQADLNVPPSELLALAREAGYPIEQIAKERGFTLPVSASEHPKGA